MKKLITFSLLIIGAYKVNLVEADQPYVRYNSGKVIMYIYQKVDLDVFCWIVM